MRNALELAFSKPITPYALAVLNAVVIGISFLFVKVTLEYASPLDTLMYRFAAAFVITVIPVVTGIIKINYRGKPILPLFLLAGTYPIGFFLLQAMGLQFATTAEGGIINACTPVMILILASVFLKEATSLLQKTGILMSVCGVVFIIVMSGSTFDLSKIKGILLLLLACLSFAVYSILTRSLSKNYSVMEISCFMVTVAFGVSLVSSMTIHAVSGTMKHIIIQLTSGTFIWLILYLGAVQLTTALLGNYVLSKLEASKSGIFANLSTVVSIIAGALILKETVTWYHLCGSVLIIVGVIGANVFQVKRAEVVSQESGDCSMEVQCTDQHPRYISYDEIKYRI